MSEENLDRKVELYEVGFRDWRLCHKKTLEIPDMLKTISLLEDAGIRHIEIGASVNYEKYPWVDNTYELLGELRKRNGKSKYSIYIGPSIKNYPRNKIDELLEKKILKEDPGMPDEICVSISASEDRCQEIYGKSRKIIRKQVLRQIKRAVKDGIPVRGYVSAVFGYYAPFDVDIVRDVIPLCRDLLKAGCYQVCLGDKAKIDANTIEEKLRIITEKPTEEDINSILKEKEAKKILKKYKIESNVITRDNLNENIAEEFGAIINKHRPVLDKSKIALHFHEPEYIKWESPIIKLVSKGFRTFDTSIVDVLEPGKEPPHGPVRPINPGIAPNASTQKFVMFEKQLKEDYGIPISESFYTGLDCDKIIAAGDYIRGYVKIKNGSLRQAG